jgi:hypothetical protein
MHAWLTPAWRLIQDVTFRDGRSEAMGMRPSWGGNRLVRNQRCYKDKENGEINDQYDNDDYQDYDDYDENNYVDY